jgi:dGTPase
MVGSMIDAVLEGSLSAGNAVGAVVMAPGPLEAMHELRTFMFERVYASETAAGQKHVAIDVIRRLVDHHLAHPELIPATYRDSSADPVTQVVDYVSGMTDRFALAMHDRLFDADASSQMTPLLRR